MLNVNYSVRNFTTGIRNKIWESFKYKRLLCFLW